jgi:hypothetical protein
MAEAVPKHGDLTPSGERLDFSAFLARFFPNRRRHDFAAITAYVAYRNEFEPPASDLTVAAGQASP